MIFDIETAKLIFGQNGVKGRQLYQRKNIEFVYLEFDKESMTDMHIQYIPMIFYVIKGKAKIIMDGEVVHLEEGQLIEIDPGKERQWINTGNDKLVLFVTKLLSGEE